MSFLDQQHETPEIGHATDMTRLDHIPTTLRNLPSKMPRTVTYRKRKSLPPAYKPGEYDVCCGRGKRHWNHVGNVRFRRFIQCNVERYMDAPTKNDKTAVVVSIVDDIRNRRGNFLKEDLRGNWYDIGDQQAREKVGHSLRDQVSTIHRQQQKQAALQQFKSPNSTTTTTNTTGSSSTNNTTSGGGITAMEAISASAAANPMAPPIRNTNNVTTMAPPQPRQQQTQRQSSWSQRRWQTRFSFEQKKQQQKEKQRMMLLQDHNSELYEAISEETAEEFAIEEEAHDDGTGRINVTDGGDDNDHDDHDDDDDAQSDGSNERTVRRSTLSSSMIIDRFARRPSFASAVVDPTNSFSTSKSSSKRSSGWSFLNELDLSMDQFDGDFQDGLEPIQYKSTTTPLPNSSSSSSSYQNG